MNLQPVGLRRRWLQSMGDTRLFALVAGPLLVVYLATATWSSPFTTDPYTNVLSAWNLGSTGSFLLDQHEQLADPDYYRNVAWVIPAEGGVANKYPPGATLLAAPLYAAWPEDARPVSLVGGGRPDLPPIEVLQPPIAPAAISAAAAVAAALGLLAVAFRRAGSGTMPALVGAYVGGLGTGAWSVAADQLWQHGPAMLWIALALVTAEHRSLLAGFAFGAAILTRPPTAVIAAATGLYLGWKDRSVRRALPMALGSLVGLGLLLAYNGVIFGTPSISGGYGASFGRQAIDGDLLTFGKNIALGLVSPRHGLLIWSPFLLVLVPGIRAAWTAAPAWARGAALGGALYLLVQYKTNNYRGGDGFFAYRYPLEAMTAAAPLLILAYREWVAKRPIAVKAFGALASASVVAHGLGATMGALS